MSRPGDALSVEAFRKAFRVLDRVSLKFGELPGGWKWFIRYPGADLRRPTAAVGLMTRDQDCFIHVEPDLDPGKWSLRISTGVAPAEVVAAVLKANHIHAPRSRRRS